MVNISVRWVFEPKVNWLPMPKFIFTFGYGQNPGIGFYTTVEANTERDARNIMNEHYQNRWSFCYDSEEKAGVQRFNLKEVPLGYKHKYYHWTTCTKDEIKFHQERTNG